MKMDVLQIRIGAEPVKEQGDLFGIFFEDLNHAADGGLYGELVQNRSFEFDPVDNPAYHALTAWEPINRGSSIGVCHVESHSPLNTKNPHYLILESTRAGAGSGIRNIGYNGGIPVEEGKTYRFSCWVRQAGRNTCSLRIQLETEDGISLSECEVLPVHAGEWTRQECLLTACGTDHSARLAIFMTESGTVALDMVSLFPSDTYKGRPNGMRKDIAELLEAMHPKFMRFPGRLPGTRWLAG